MTLAELQHQVDEWIRQHGGYWPDWVLLGRLVEEVGEVAAALQRLEGYRPRPAAARLDEEMGDLLFILTAFANARGLELEDCLRQAIEKYNRRDSAAWKEQGC